MNELSQLLDEYSYASGEYAKQLANDAPLKSAHLRLQDARIAVVRHYDQQAARIAELEAALREIARYADVHCPAPSHQPVMAAIQQVVERALGDGE